MIRNSPAPVFNSNQHKQFLRLLLNAWVYTLMWVCKQKEQWTFKCDYQRLTKTVKNETAAHSFILKVEKSAALAYRLVCWAMLYLMAK